MEPSYTEMLTQFGLVVLVPLIMAKLKRLFGTHKWLIPIAAPAIGIVADLAITWGASLAGTEAGAGAAWKAALAGALAVWARELYDQTKKATQGFQATKAITVLLIPLALLAGCGTFGSLATPGEVDPVMLTAETAAIVGEQAVATNELYRQLCTTTPPRLPAERCNAWTAFYTSFKTKYAEAHAAFKAALAAGDIVGSQQPARVIRSLMNTLLLYYIAREGA